MSEPVLRSSTQTFRPELVQRLRSLKPGQRIRLIQHVRIGSTTSWKHVIEGVFRGVQFLATGLATHRVPEDDIVVVTVHFTKDNHELSSVALDENSEVEALS